MADWSSLIGGNGANKVPEGPAIDIAVQGEKIEQICKDIASIEQNVEKIANGQEVRLRDLETHKAQAEERWEAHWNVHAATSQVMDNAWADHAIAHAELTKKQKVADVANATLTTVLVTIAAFFGFNK